mgnify:FL=1|jgi:micrococcal nuclease
MYEYGVVITRVVDGDTVDIDIDLGFGVWLKGERVRLHGVDTPESRTRDLEEKKYGLAAKEYVEEYLNAEVILGISPAKAILRTKQYDAKGKFGRILGDLYVDGKPYTLCEGLLRNHHAVAYHGQSKEDIEEEHLKNRELVKLKE